VQEGDVAVGVIDARRMEVFAGCYRRVATGWERLTAPGAVVLDGEGPEAAQRFGVELGGRTWFVGDAAMKMRALLDGPGRWFVDRPATAAAMVQAAWVEVGAGRFADLAYTSPDYGKTYQPGKVRNPFAT
jgi:tRNA A37 threonylcarbamoyladenosine modification protein TsaB